MYCVIILSTPHLSPGLFSTEQLSLRHTSITAEKLYAHIWLNVHDCFIPEVGQELYMHGFGKKLGLERQVEKLFGKSEGAESVYVGEISME